MQWRGAIVLTVILWFLGLPLIAYLTLGDKMEVAGLWDILVLCYTLIQFCMCACYIGPDWERTGRPSDLPPQQQEQQQKTETKRLIEFRTKPSSSFLTITGGTFMTEKYQLAYEEAKGTIRRFTDTKNYCCGSPTNGTYTSVCYGHEGSERITYFSATQLHFEPISDFDESTIDFGVRAQVEAQAMVNVDLCPGPAATTCWKITGQGNDSDGGFVISEGFVVANGDAYWIEESTDYNNSNAGSSHHYFPDPIVNMQNTTTTRAMILNRGVIDFRDNSFTGSWISNTTGAVERPHHPEFRLQQSFQLAKQDAIQNVLLLPQRDQPKTLPPQPQASWTATIAAAVGPPKSLASSVVDIQHSNSLRAASFPSLWCPVFTMPPTSGLYRCGCLEKGVFVWFTIRLFFEPSLNHDLQQQLMDINNKSKEEQDEAANDITASDIPLTTITGNRTTDNTRTQSSSFVRDRNNVGRHDDETWWRISGNATNSLGMTFNIVEGLVSAKTGIAYWVEQEQSPPPRQSAVEEDDYDDDVERSTTTNTRNPGRLFLSTGTFSFVMQDFVGWRQGCNDARSSRYQEFCLLQEEEVHPVWVENETPPPLQQVQEHTTSTITAYQMVYKHAKSRVEEDMAASWVSSPSLSGYYYNDSCSPTSGIYTFSHSNYYKHPNSSRTTKDEEPQQHIKNNHLVISTVRLHFEANIDKNNNHRNSYDEEVDNDYYYDPSDDYGSSRRSWTITGAGTNALDGSDFSIIEGLVSASGKAYWVQTTSTSDTVQAAAESSSSSSLFSTTTRTDKNNKSQPQHVICTGEFVFSPLSHEINFRGGWCASDGQKRWFHQFCLTSH